MAILKIGSVNMPDPTEFAVDDEILWSANAGRNVKGNMIADVINQKKKLNIKWGILTNAEMQLIMTNIKAGFFSVTFDDGTSSKTINVYRGTMTKTRLNPSYYLDANVNLIEK